MRQDIEDFIAICITIVFILSVALGTIYGLLWVLSRPIVWIIEAFN